MCHLYKIHYCIFHTSRSSSVCTLCLSSYPHTRLYSSVVSHRHVESATVICDRKSPALNKNLTALVLYCLCKCSIRDVSYEFRRGSQSECQWVSLHGKLCTYNKKHACKIGVLSVTLKTSMPKQTFIWSLHFNNAGSVFSMVLRHVYCLVSMQVYCQYTIRYSSLKCTKAMLWPFFMQWPVWTLNSNPCWEK